MLSDEPDLTADLDAAEEIVMGHAETVVTEWGVRYDVFIGTKPRVAVCDNERDARETADGTAHTLVRRTVTYGPWEAPGEQCAETGDPGSAGEAQPG